MTGDYRDPDPIERAVPALASALLAVVVSMPIAALIGGLIGIDYQTRAVIYVALLGWVVCGAIVLFIGTLRAPRQPLSLRLVLVWTASIWVWPLLWFGRRKR